MKISKLEFYLAETIEPEGTLPDAIHDDDEGPTLTFSPRLMWVWFCGSWRCRSFLGDDDASRCLDDAMVADGFTSTLTRNRDAASVTYRRGATNGQGSDASELIARGLAASHTLAILPTAVNRLEDDRDRNVIAEPAATTDNTEES